VGGLERLLANHRRITPFVGMGATIAAFPESPFARWQGLLEDGIRTCEEFGLSTEWAESTTARLRTGDLIAHLAIADEISRRLAEIGEWNDWIKGTVGRLRVPGSSPMHAAICRLNRIVLTTNYDRLLEEASNRKSLHSRQAIEVRETINTGEHEAVIHLQGVATSPESVILGNWREGLHDDMTVYFWTEILLSRRLLFIGCGSGLHDSDIDPALQFVEFVSSAHQNTISREEPELSEHYILVPGYDLAGARTAFSGSKVVPVAYGLEYSDLERFLIDLIDGREPRPSQNVRDYVFSPHRTANVKVSRDSRSHSERASANQRNGRTALKKPEPITQQPGVHEPTVKEDELSASSTQASRGRRAFVVHGHDGDVKYQVAGFLEKITGERPVILHEQVDSGRTIIEKFEDYASEAGFAVVLLTADDRGRASNENKLRPRARQNVVFELGFFLGRLGRDRVVALYQPGVELPSDLSGVLYKPLTGNWHTELARELRAAGINVDLKKLLLE
jgi:predicted nucleotide-binding protein